MRARAQACKLLAIAMSWSLATGCYVLKPVVSTSLPLGARIGLDLNDAGRASLGASMGQEIALIEGRLVRFDSGVYVVSVSDIHFLRGGQQAWSGERVQVKQEFVSAVRERTFSRSRTAAIGAAAVGVLAMIVRASIVGSSSGDDGVLPPDTAMTSRIPRR
jgi:hypothetical protein